MRGRWESTRAASQLCLLPGPWMVAVAAAGSQAKPPGAEQPPLGAPHPLLEISTTWFHGERLRRHGGSELAKSTQRREDREWGTLCNRWKDTMHQIRCAPHKPKGGRDRSQGRGGGAGVGTMGMQVSVQRRIRGTQS